MFTCDVCDKPLTDPSRIQWEYRTEWGLTANEGRCAVGMYCGRKCQMRDTITARQARYEESRQLLPILVDALGFIGDRRFRYVEPYESPFKQEEDGL